MKSREVYAVLKHELAPFLKSLGFKRQKSFLSWSRRRGDLHTVLWCQVSRDGWDSFAGSRFVVEFQLTGESEPGAGSGRRQRIGRLISDTQREEVRRIQNAVISSLRRPSDQYLLQMSPDVSEWYLAKFNPVAQPYKPGDDIWLRYATAEHVREWASFVTTVIPQCIESIEAMVVPTGHEPMPHGSDSADATHTEEPRPKPWAN